MKAASETSYTLRNTEKAFFTRTTLTFRKNRSSSHNFSFFSSISIMPLLSSPTAQRVRLYFNVLRTPSVIGGRAGGRRLRPPRILRIVPRLSVQQSSRDCQFKLRCKC